MKIILFNIHTCTHRLLCIRYLCGTAVLFNKERHSKWCVRATEGKKLDLAINPLAVSNLNTLVDLLSKKLSCDPRYEIAFFFQSMCMMWSSSNEHIDMQMRENGILTKRETASELILMHL